MRDQRNVWLVAAGTSLALVLAGCGSRGPVIEVSTSTSVLAPSSGDVPVESADAVLWMDGFCGAVEDFLADTGTMGPSTEFTSDEGQKVFSTMLGDYAAILGKAIDSLEDLPPIADPVGQTAKQTFVGNYTSARDTVTSAKAELDVASPSDVEAQMHASEAMTAAQQTALSAVSPEMAIMTSPELSTALMSAHRCMSTS